MEEGEMEAKMEGMEGAVQCETKMVETWKLLHQYISSSMQSPSSSSLYFLATAHNVNLHFGSLTDAAL